MKTLKTIIIVFAIVVILGYLILGNDEFWFNARGWQAETQNVLREAGPANVQLEKMEAEIRAAERNIYDLSAAARMAAGDSEAMSRQASELEVEVSNLHEQVEIGKRLLREGRSEYVVQGRALSPSEFVQVVNYKADEYARLAAQLESTRDNAEAQKSMAETLAQQSRNLDAMIQAERMELVQLKRDYPMARVGRDMANIVSDINLDSDVFADGPYSRIKRSLREEAYRLQAEAEHKMRRQGISMADQVDLRDPADPEYLDSALREIDRKMGIAETAPARREILDPATVAITE